jgi:hypothetical protein
MRYQEKRYQEMRVIEDGLPHLPVEPVQSLADMVVYRVFAVGLVLQSAAGLADGPAARRLTQAVDELDDIIRAVRSAALSAHREADPRGDDECERVVSRFRASP